MNSVVGIVISALVGVLCLALIIYVLLRNRPRVAARGGGAGQVPGYTRVPSSVEYRRPVQQQAAPRPKQSKEGAAQDLRDVPLPRCPDCGTAISYGEKRCPKCGKVLRPL